MNRTSSIQLKVSAVCGVLAPTIAFACILLSIAFYPQFTWFNNALSDLGVVEGVTSVLFNLGLIISGFSALIFGLGLLVSFRDKALGITGALLFMIDALALALIGVFNENLKPMHYYFSVIFFMLYPVSILVLCSEYLLSKRMKMGLFTFATAAFAGTVWAVQFTFKPFPGVAIPETLSALAASTWAVVVSVKTFKQSSHGKG
jgi:hypothetical membrane protein